MLEAHDFWAEPGNTHKHESSQKLLHFSPLQAHIINSLTFIFNLCSACNYWAFRYDGEWKEGKEHGYGTKFWPIVEKDRSEDSEDTNNSGSTAANPEGGEGSNNSHEKDEQKKKEPKIEYDKYEGMWKDGWEHGIGKYTW